VENPWNDLSVVHGPFSTPDRYAAAAGDIFHPIGRAMKTEPVVSDETRLTLHARATSPELLAALERAKTHKMTPEEYAEQRRSWVRGELMLAHPEMTIEKANALIEAVLNEAPKIVHEAITHDAAYRIALRACGERYLGMATETLPGRLLGIGDFIQEFLDGCAEMPLCKLNRWLGYIQGTLITHGFTTVTAERDWSRPLFRPLDYPGEAG
jgi:predicted NAD-dependent protein-ADP-ribosyltransferase YbiA (DUF1768 family)